jgi:hypothetical protein
MIRSACSIIETLLQPIHVFPSITHSLFIFRFLPNDDISCSALKCPLRSDYDCI